MSNNIFSKIILACLVALTVFLCSCRAATDVRNGVADAGRDLYDAGRDVVHDVTRGTTASGGATYSKYSRNGTGEAGSYTGRIPNGAVNGGDTVGNSINKIMGRNAVGETDGMTGTSTNGTRNSAAYGTNGINAGNAGGSVNPNYTR